MLKIENLSWTTEDGTEVLRDVSLEIPDGKVVVITGPNGSGKTSLAKLIAGIYKPTSGKIILNGEDITDEGITERARRGVSYAFQQPVRFKGLTVSDLIALSSKDNLSRPDMCDVLVKVGLCATDYIDREVDSTLSGGEIKRIEIASVISRHSVLTVFDEPEAGIDLWSFTNLIDVFREMQKNLNGSLIIISHQERIIDIADELVVITDGEITACGPKDEVMPSLLEGKGCRKMCEMPREGIF
ncbi:MAG: ATP-binding cassette domain-containing protein [Eubacteriaceae bacterium]|nr:ATP-binding cassette domain-containing protein [Eubacteriaceae bacterium]MBQ1465585.1 ATP-binding cassette domain-containing protein [Eubacteriaceae bacterium]MCR4894218.1 ATP-binding cassette domain-containing protein [Eubacteriales bacterium]